MTSIFFSFANIIASQDKVPQSTVKINITSWLINFSNPDIDGPYPSNFHQVYIFHT